MGKEAKDVLAKLKRGDKDALFRIKQNVKTDDKFQLEVLVPSSETQKSIFEAS